MATDISALEARVVGLERDQATLRRDLDRIFTKLSALDVSIAKLIEWLHTGEVSSAKKSGKCEVHAEQLRVFAEWKAATEKRLTAVERVAWGFASVCTFALAAWAVVKEFIK